MTYQTGSHRVYLFSASFIISNGLCVAVLAAKSSLKICSLALSHVFRALSRLEQAPDSRTEATTRTFIVKRSIAPPTDHAFRLKLQSAKTYPSLEYIFLCST